MPPQLEKNHVLPTAWQDDPQVFLPLDSVPHLETHSLVGWMERKQAGSCVGCPGSIQCENGCGLQGTVQTLTLDSAEEEGAMTLRVSGSTSPVLGGLWRPHGRLLWPPLAATVLPPWIEAPFSEPTPRAPTKGHPSLWARPHPQPSSLLCSWHQVCLLLPPGLELQ